MSTVLLVVMVAASPQSEVVPWKARLDRVETNRERLSTSLEQVHAVLRPRVERERPDLLDKLEAPKTDQPGYGVIPVLAEDQPEIEELPPSESRFDMVELDAWIARERRSVGELEAMLEITDSDVAKLADSYELRMKNYRTIDSQIGYHDLWQGNIHRNPKGWDHNQQLLAEYRAHPEGNPAGVGSRLREDFMKFSRRMDHRLVEKEDGTRELAISLMTDIQDKTFLKAFADGIERYWNGAEAMTDAGVRIRLELKHVSPESLYPEGPPAHGEKIDKLKHLARFAPGFVLTTGVASTHVFGGRAILVGAKSVEPHELAHEFAHLLGFQDRYLRAYERAVGHADGVVVVEISAFRNDIMGNSSQGKVKPWMVAKLIEAYTK